MKQVNPFLLIDSYKIFHSQLYPTGTEYLYSNLTPRSNKYSKSKANKIVFFGLQYVIKKWLIEYFNENFFNLSKEDAMKDIIRCFTKAYFTDYSAKIEEIAAIHELGYLPIEIKAIEEGNQVNIGVPPFIIINTKPEHKFITQYLETLLSQNIWPLITNATDIKAARDLFDKAAQQTSDIPEFVQWQGHNFGARGCFGTEASLMVDLAHQTCFTGSDTVGGMVYAEQYYNADIDTGLITSSVNATEHSLMCLNIANIEHQLNTTGVYKQWTKQDALANGFDKEDFKLACERIFVLDLLTNLVPEGILAVVSDTFDFWSVLTKILPDPEVKAAIMNRNGKYTVRPDSGSVIHTIAGYNIERLDTTVEEFLNVTWNSPFKLNSNTEVVKLRDGYVKVNKTTPCVSITEAEAVGAVEWFYNVFGGSINSKGYKQLDDHIGLVYGDAITLEVIATVNTLLANKGFASTNWLAGIGAAFYQHQTRDSYSQALKATHATVNGNEMDLQKLPKTDSTKKSAKGLLQVTKDLEGNYVLKDQCTSEEEATGELVTVFKDGKMIKETSLEEIRFHLWN